MKRKTLAAAGASLALVCAVGMAGSLKQNVSADEPDREGGGDIKIDATNFPDQGFRDYIEYEVDDGDGILTKTEIMNTKRMTIDTTNIKSLKGVEFFTYLQELSCYPSGGYGSDPEGRGLITELDLSKNTELTSLGCSGNHLTSLDLSANTKLTWLSCGCNEIKELNISANNELVHLDVCENELTVLDVSEKTKLERLYCFANKIETLDTSKLLELKELDCYNNKLTELDVSNNTKLTELDCTLNKLTKLDVSMLADLQRLHCGWNNLEGFDVSKNVKLVYLDCDGCMLKELDLTQNTKLEQLYCSYNELTNIDLSNNTVLRGLVAIHNSFAKLDVSKCTPIVEFISDPETVREIHKDSDEDEEYYVYVKGSTGVLLHDCDTELIPKFTGRTVTPAPTPGTIADFVERLYTEALGRPSEEAGKKYWIEEITNGRKTGGDCGLFFLLGEEFTNRKLSEEDLVETLYKTFFGRESEPDGKAFWVGQLKNGVSRESVVRGFIDSKEWCNLCADYGVKSGAPTAKAEKASRNAIYFAERLYMCCLEREPEAAGLQYWSLALTNLEKTGAEAAKQFFGSEEFKNIGDPDINFVYKLYTTFMDREPSKKELVYWESEIAKGTQTRDSVLSFFAQSEEFTNLCAKYGIERGTI